MLTHWKDLLLIKKKRLMLTIKDKKNYKQRSKNNKINLRTAVLSFIWLKTKAWRKWKRNTSKSMPNSKLKNKLFQKTSRIWFKLSKKLAKKLSLKLGIKSTSRKKMTKLKWPVRLTNLWDKKVNWLSSWTTIRISRPRKNIKRMSLNRCKPDLLMNLTILLLCNNKFTLKKRRSLSVT